MRQRFKTVICEDGFDMSVQASSFHYCSPREDKRHAYTSVEVGFPSDEEPLLMQWVEDPDKPTETVYGYVPAAVILAVIAKHGGVASGELPPLSFSPNH